MQTHIMLDLETLSLANNARIVSIGAAAFNKEQVLETFYQVLDLDEKLKGFSIESSTVAWWLRQSPEAISSTFTSNGVKLHDALFNFDRFYKSFKEPVPIWANSASFDLPILANAFKAVHATPPWSYRDERCFRTIKALYPLDSPPKNKLGHNAVADAVAQAEYLIACGCPL